MTRGASRPRAATPLPLGVPGLLTEDVGDLLAGSAGRVVGYYGPRDRLEYAVSFGPGGLLRLPRSVLA